MIGLSIDARRAKTKLQERKDKLSIPTKSISQKEEEARIEREQTKKFLNDVRSVMSSYNEQPFRVGDDVELKFSIDDKSRQIVEASIVNNATFFEDNYVIREGEKASVDYQRLTRDLTLIANQDKILKMTYDQGVSAGKELVADQLENATEEPGSSKESSQSSYEDQISEFLSKRRFDV